MNGKAMELSASLRFSLAGFTVLCISFRGYSCIGYTVWCKEQRPTEEGQPPNTGLRRIFGPARSARWPRLLSLCVEPVEKVRWQKLQEKRPPYLPFKRRSQIEEPFWYPHFGQFSVVRDFFYSLVRVYYGAAEGN